MLLGAQRLALECAQLGLSGAPSQRSLPTDLHYLPDAGGVVEVRTFGGAAAPQLNPDLRVECVRFRL